MLDSNAPQFVADAEAEKTTSKQTNQLSFFLDSNVPQFVAKKRKRSANQPAHQKTPKLQKPPKPTHDIIKNKHKNMREVPFCTYLQLCRIPILLYFKNHDYEVNRKIKSVVMLAVIRFALGALPGVSHKLEGHLCRTPVRCVGFSSGV